MRAIEPIDVMRYCVSYWDIEEPILKALASYNRENKIRALNWYANKYMGIGRNFKPGHFPKAYEISVVYMNATNSPSVEELSNRLYGAIILNFRTKNALVAASKLLWLHDHETVIMDSRAKQALCLAEGISYGDFVIAWKKCYKEKEEEISISLRTVEETLTLPVMQEDWFKMRVFDQYLWAVASYRILNYDW